MEHLTGTSVSMTKSLPAASELIDWRSLVGLNLTMRDLGLLMDSGRMHPVILLESRKGYGKRHLAMWLAARLLCQASSGAQPCGVCGSCSEILAGVHPDVVVLNHHDDPIKTADVESFQRHFDILSSGGLRIGVIMNADLMTKEAYNRALKTLEEPAAQARIIMTTSRPLALPATILGRCLRWRVVQPARDEVLAWSREQMKVVGRALDDASLMAWIGRRGFSPGLVYRSIFNSEGQDDHLIVDVRSLLLANNPATVLRSAANLARIHKVKLPVIMEMVEWELGAAYREWFSSGKPSALSQESLRAKILRRRTLSAVRSQAILGKVVLNAQLVAESIGLARWHGEAP